MRHYQAALAALVTTALLASCKTEPGQSADAGGTAIKEDQSSALARYTKFAGEPVKQFTWLGRFDSWEPLSNDQLVVYTTPTEAYLLKVWGPCRDLPFATTMGLSSTGRTVYSGLDSVVVRGQRCPISEVRPVDVKKMREEMKAQRAEKAQAPQ
jgi:hypothetical protein